MTTPPPPPQPRFEIRGDPDLENGAYANFLAVWHTAHDFTLDFCIAGQPVQGADGVTVAARLTARVKMPPTLVFEVMKALNENLAGYEQQYGPIKRPGEDDTR